MLIFFYLHYNVLNMHNAGINKMHSDHLEKIYWKQI